MLTSDQIEILTIFFDWVDTDKDGFISKDEIIAACAVDLNADGVIDEIEKLQSAKDWLTTYLPLQDGNLDDKLTIEELLAFNLV